MNTTNNKTANDYKNELIEQLTKRKESLEFQMNLDKNCLVAHNKIVKIGEDGIYTVGTNDQNHMIHERVDNPSRWTDAGVKEILSAPKFINANGEEIDFVVMNVKDWYQTELNQVNSLLEPLLK